MRVHREGRTSLLILATFILLVNYAAIKITQNLWIIYPLFVASLGLYLFVMYFFRFVNRTTISDDRLVIAPCDGKVVVIEEVEETEVLNQKRIMVSIFMSPLNVHINWFPVSGKILEAIRHKGSHLVAWAPKASTHNERSTVVIETPGGQTVLVRQIAGAVARRVVCYAKKGGYAEQNDHLGFIKFGSRVDLYLPLGSEIKVQLNQRTIGNQTVVARLNEIKS
jgi:phosphatidylserine decarboxylase